MKARRFFVVFLGLPVFALAGAVQPDATPPAGRADAYFNYSMGHLYSELAAAYGNRGEYLNRAIEHMQQAMKDDPSASFLSGELASVYLQAGRIREAVTELEQRIEKDPKDVEARRVLGNLYARLIGDPESGRINGEILARAIEQYQKLVENAPEDADGWLMLGRLHRLARNPQGSEKAFQRALEIEPDSEDAMMGLAMLYSSMGDNRRAAQLLKQLAGSNPSPRTLTSLAEAYEGMRDFAGAAEALSQLVELDPSNLDFKRALAQDLLFAGKADEALEIYAEVTREEPEDTQSWVRMSQIYRRKREYAKAHEALARARQAEPDNLEALYAEVSLLDAEGRTAEAVAAMEHLLKSTEKSFYTAPERETRVTLMETLARLYRSAGQYSRAVEVLRAIPELDSQAAPRAEVLIFDTYREARDYKRAAEAAAAAYRKFPGDRLVAENRALLLADLGQAEEAVAEAKKLFTSENDSEAWLTLARVYEKNKDYQGMGQALEAVEKLIDGDEARANLHFLRGARFERLKEYDAAEQEFRRALALEPDNPTVLNYLGYMLADRNVRLEEACQLIRRAVDMDPQNGAYLDSLGWVYFRMGKLDEAEMRLRQALTRAAHDPTVRDHLGDVLFAQGKLREAIVEWQASLNEWEASLPSERDASEIARVARKLEDAKVRFAQQSSGASQRP